MATWLSLILSRINGTAEPRDRKRRDADGAIGFGDSGMSGMASGNSTEYVADGPSTADGSFDAAFGGGQSGGAGAGSEYSGADSSDSSGGDSGGGDGGGGGD